MNETQTTEKLLTAKAVGEMLSLSRRQIFRLNSCGRISSFLWKLYEKTLKVIVDAVLERVWPKQ